MRVSENCKLSVLLAAELLVNDNESEKSAEFVLYPTNASTKVSDSVRDLFKTVVTEVVSENAISSDIDRRIKLGSQISAYVKVSDNTCEDTF